MLPSEPSNPVEISENKAMRNLDINREDSDMQAKYASARLIHKFIAKIFIFLLIRMNKQQ